MLVQVLQGGGGLTILLLHELQDVSEGKSISVGSLCAGWGWGGFWGVNKLAHHTRAVVGLVTEGGYVILEFLLSNAAQAGGRGYDQFLPHGRHCGNHEGSQVGADILVIRDKLGEGDTFGKAPGDVTKGLNGVGGARGASRDGRGRGNEALGGLQVSGEGSKAWGKQGNKLFASAGGISVIGGLGIIVGGSQGLNTGRNGGKDGKDVCQARVGRKGEDWILREMAVKKLEAKA